MLGAMLLLVGSVSALEDDCTVNVLSPEEGEWYTNTIDIEWSYSGTCDLIDQEVYYKEGSCESDFISIDEIDNTYQREVSWDAPSEGTYCICVNGQRLGPDVLGCSGEFDVDLTPPEADANGPYECDEGDSVTFDGSDSVDLESGIDTWEWFVDGDSVGFGETFEYDCEDGDMLLDVELVVTDNVGLTDSDSTEVEINNLDPWDCSIIADHSDVALGFPVEFSGYAEDVDADIPLDFYWDFNDSTADIGMDVVHTFEVAGMHEIMLTVMDKDGGETTCSIMVDVVEPILLDNQEVAAYYPLMADFGEDAGSNYGHRGSFVTGLSGMDHTDCEVLVGPENLASASLTDGECVVVWDNDEIAHPMISANPTNDEQGDHTVVIRVENDDEEYAYFAFTITVYSWIIDLEEGWNLVSIPYIPDDTSIESVILDQLGDEGQGILPGGYEYVVWSYQFDPCFECGPDSNWLKSRATGYGDLDTVVPGHAYFIKTDGVGKLRGFGTQIAQTGEFPGMPPEVELPTNNWALIGRYGILGNNKYHYPGETCWDAGAIKKSTALESLSKLDNELHVYEITEDAHLDEVYYLWNNMGYWLWIEDEAQNNAESETYAPLDKYYREDLDCESSCLSDCQLA